MTEPLTAEPPQPAQVKALFAGIARRYDLINDLQSLGLHRRWKRWLVTLAQPQVGDRALDVCCGTGDIAFELARRGAAVVGLDFSEPMLQAAQQRAARTGTKPGSPTCPGSNPVGSSPFTRRTVGTLCFVQADALRLPFIDRSFDIVTIGYGLRNLADWQAGLADLWRVLRPGGRLLVLDFGKPPQPLWRSLYFGYLRWVVPLLGRLLCGNAPAYSYILQSLQAYPAQLGVAARLSALPAVEGVWVLNLLGGAMSIHFARKAS